VTDVAFADDPDPRIKQLGEAILSQRGPTRRMLIDVKRLVSTESLADSTQIPLVIDAFVSQLGCERIVPAWTKISHSQAVHLLARILARHLAYGINLIPPDQARMLAGKFLALFPLARQCFTNGVPYELSAGMDNPLPFKEYSGLFTALEEEDGWVVFDTGVVVISGDRIGILWIADSE
jgi:hypothetical protein